MTDNKITLTIPEDDGSTRTASFLIAPNIGHCLELQNRGIDLLGNDSDADVAKLVANMPKFCEILEVLIGSDDDQFQMPALAGLLDAPTWVQVRRVVLESFTDFFREGGYPQIAAALDRLRDASETITNQIAQSLEAGELRNAIDREVAKVTQGLAEIGG